MLSSKTRPNIREKTKKNQHIWAKTTKNNLDFQFDIFNAKSEPAKNFLII